MHYHFMVWVSKNTFLAQNDSASGVDPYGSMITLAYDTDQQMYKPAITNP